MKKLCLLLSIFFSLVTYAQVPAGFNYQAVLRDSTGEVMANETNIPVRIKILKNGTDSVYVENHTVSTNDFGLFTLGIGKGTTSNSPNGNISLIDWSQGTYSLKVEVDFGGGFLHMGTQQLLTVPFAMLSNNVGPWSKNTSDVYYENGNVGIGTNSPNRKLHVIGRTLSTDSVSAPYSIFANSDPPPSAGTIIYGNNTANAGANQVSYGLYGITQSSSFGSAGVVGVANAPSVTGFNEIGVLGDYFYFGAAVHAVGWNGEWMPTLKDFGVYATLDYDDGHAVHGRNDDQTMGSAFAVYAEGNSATTGTKSASVPTSKGNQLVYSFEGPEIWFEDLGFAQLENGEATVEIDPLFLEMVVIDEDHPMHVFIEEYGECNDLYVIRNDDSFIIKEKNNGTSNIEFSYRIVAKRANYQDHRFGMDNYFGYGDTRDQFEYVPPYPVEPEVVKQHMQKALKEKERIAQEMLKARKEKNLNSEKKAE